METIEFNKIPELPEFRNLLTFDGDKTDFRLHSENHILWFEKDQKEYEKIEKLIDKYEVSKEHYHIYAWCDISGYDYWINQQKEENYIQLSVMFNKSNIPLNCLNELRHDIDNAFRYFDQFESLHPRMVIN